MEIHNNTILLLYKKKASGGRQTTPSAYIIISYLKTVTKTNEGNAQEIETFKEREREGREQIGSNKKRSSYWILPTNFL